MIFYCIRCCKLSHCLKIKKPLEKWFYSGKGFWQMILWWKRILGNDFMEKDLVKWFYSGKGFWEMILWKRIWLNDFMVEKDFGKWFYGNGFG